MTNVVIVVEDGRVTDVYCRNKNVQVEVIDLDVDPCDDEEERELRAKERRIEQIENSKTYKNIW